MNIKDLLFALYPDILWIQGHPHNDFELADGKIVKWNAAKLGPLPTMEFLEQKAKDLEPQFLLEAQTQRCWAIKKLCEDKLASHYSVFDLLSLSTTLMEASATGLTNRTKYLYPLKAWSAGAYDFFYAKQTEVLACKSVEEVQAVKDPDFSSWEALKPDVKYEAAMAIKD